MYWDDVSFLVQLLPYSPPPVHFVFFEYLAETDLILQKHSGVSLSSISQLVNAFQCSLVLVFFLETSLLALRLSAAMWAACHPGVGHSGRWNSYCAEQSHLGCCWLL